jgi:restriction endonuclease Mrr
VLADGQTWRKRDMERAIAERAGITSERLDETLDSGQGRADNRIGWGTSALRRRQRRPHAHTSCDFMLHSAPHANSSFEHAQTVA